MPSIPECDEDFEFERRGRAVNEEQHVQAVEARTARLLSLETGGASSGALRALGRTQGRAGAAGGGSAAGRPALSGSRESVTHADAKAARDPFATMYSEAPRLATWAMNHHPEAFGQPTGRQVAPFSGRGMKTALQAMPAPDQAPTAESGHAIWQVDALRRRQGMTQSELKLEATVRCVTQAPKRASGMRCALSDAEWRLIEPILPCRPRCEPRTTSLRADVNWSRGTLSAVVARAPRTPTVVLRIDPSPPKKAPGCQAFPQSILK